MEISMQTEKTHFLFLNREGRWQDFAWSGLERREDGSLGLIRLPALEGDLPPELEQQAELDRPAGIAVTADGTIYYTDPVRHLLLKIGPCPIPEQGSPASCEIAPIPRPGDRRAVRSIPLVEPTNPWTPVACLGGRGDQGTQFDAPRGLLYHPLRDALMVADSGNHRIQLFDPASYQLLEIWGQEGTEPGSFQQPWSLATDAKGNVYVVDYGNQRLQKFDRWGNVLADFWGQVEASLQRENLTLDQPGQVAVGEAGDMFEVYLLDVGKRQIFAFDASGRLLRPPFGEDMLDSPMGLVATTEAIYVGDNRRRRIYQFSPQGVFIGAAIRYDGPVAALTLDDRGGLWALAQPKLAPLQLATQGGFSRKGFLWGGPFSNPGWLPQEWHRLKASLEPLVNGAHFQLFLYCSGDPDADPIGPQPSAPPWGEPVVDYLDCLVTDPQAPACERKWIRMPLDVSEGMIQAIQTHGLPPGQWEYLSYVWVGAEFSGEGLSSPILSQLWLEFDHQTTLGFLPSVYGEQDRSRQYLGRFLSLFESLYDEAEEGIRGLPSLLDPQSARADFLPWLGGWQAFGLIEEWPLAKKRQAIQDAFTLHSQRGTVAGLQAAVRLFTGLQVRIEEPIQHTGWWSLAPEEGTPLETENSILGFTTFLVPAEAQGAVVGTTAVLDASHLITEEELGAPLFSDTAHRFIVQVYHGAGYSPQALAQVAAVLDREKPAHTHYHICPVEPRLRIGFQARIGIDTVIASEQGPTALDQLDGSGDGWQLGGEPPGLIGERSQVGQTTRLAS
jgi:phage tail-like protein